jgi:hypothetical protein
MRNTPGLRGESVTARPAANFQQPERTAGVAAPRGRSAGVFMVSSTEAEITWIGH